MCALSQQVSLHTSVDFSSVFVVVNLQTWVVLFDYLGIGVPTPPSSRPPSPTAEDNNNSSGGGAPPSMEKDTAAGGVRVGGSANFTPRTEDETEALRDPPEPGLAIISSLLHEDALDFLSLGGSADDDGGANSSSIGRVTSQGDVCMPLAKTGSSQCLPDPSAATELGTSDVRDDEASGALPPGGREGEKGKGEEEEEGEGEGEEEPTTVWGVEGKLSADVAIEVRSLTVTFNKPEHPLARGSVHQLSTRLGVSHGNVELSGSLGQASVVDLTTTGALYRERYITARD